MGEFYFLRPFKKYLQL